MKMPMAFKVEEAAAELNISRAKMFELLKTNEVESIKIGRSRRIPAAALVAYIERLRVVQGAVAEPGGEQRDLLGALLRGGDHAA